jgi:hypothetical protein
MSMISAKYVLRCTIAAAMLLTGACTKIGLVPNNETPPPKFSDKSKVLIIVVDGLSGWEMKKIKPPVLKGLMSHSTYSWDAQADSVTNDAASWANIMTGVKIDKSNIWDSTLTPHTPSGARFASFLTLLKQSGQRTLNAMAVTGWDQLNKTLMADATVKVTTRYDDAVVRDSAVNRLKSSNPDLMITHFSSVNKAGKAAAFSATEPAYATAVNNVDGYIGDLITAMKSRPDYANENWLVIVQSTHGGKDNTYGGDSEEERNAFSLYYCPDLYEHEVEVPMSIKSAVNLRGKNAETVNAVLNDKNAYNFGTDNFTIETKMRMANAGYNAYYPAFLSKRASFDQRVSGWCFFQEGNLWQINFGYATGNNIQCKGTKMNDGSWHHLSAVVYKDAVNKRWVKTYTDGAFNNIKEITAAGNVNTTAPLTMGWIPGSDGNEANLYMSDVRIWADSLSDADIANFSCTNDIDARHPKYAKLIGYWPALERKGNVIGNQAPAAAGKDFILTDGYSWDLLNYVLPCAGNIGLQPPPNTREVFVQVAYWLNLQINADWEINGRLWLKFF